MIETMFVKRYPFRGSSSSAGKHSSPPPPQTVNVAHLRVGSYYEIDHSVQRSPEQLKSIRIGSNRMNRSKPERRSNASLLPVLDESHVVSSELAEDLLYRRVAPHQVSMRRRNSWVSGNDDINLSRAQGRCLSELMSGGMIKWGKRMRVRYQSRHKEEEDGGNETNAFCNIPNCDM